MQLAKIDLEQDPIYLKELRDLVDSQNRNPGCCHFWVEAQGIILDWRITDCGDRESCDRAVERLGGHFVEYTPGVNCPTP